MMVGLPLDSRGWGRCWSGVQYSTFSTSTERIFVHDVPIDRDGQHDTHFQELLYWYQLNRKPKIASSN